jgi:Fe-S cluster assembly iron-binding protein IscA
MSVEFGEDASGFGTRIRLTERQRVTNLRLRMTRGASIAGVVSDPSGGRLHGGNMQVTATPGPNENDQVVEAAGAHVYLEPQAAAYLEDKVLDAEVDSEGKAHFSLGMQGTDQA